MSKFIDKKLQAFWSEFNDRLPDGFIMNDLSNHLEKTLTDTIQEIEDRLPELDKIRQISGFERDELGRWWKLHETGRNLVTDVMLNDSLNVRQEYNDRVNQYRAEVIKLLEEMK